VKENPVLVEVTRGGMVESRHRGSLAVMRSDGQPIALMGDVERLIYPRSAIKPLQALFLIESGAADAFNLGHRHLALACASHNGEADHVDTVLQWLNHIGLAEADLECGAHPPRRGKDRKRLILDGRDAGAAHNNCSGKHTGFLSSAKHLGLSTRGYIERAHPVQTAVLDILASLGDTGFDDVPEGFDGCGIPVAGISLHSLALAFARFADHEMLSQKRAQAAQRVFEAMVDEPFMVAGTDRWCTRALRAGSGAFIVKTGAEGVFCAAVPRAKIGIAIKIDDGAHRASESAMGAVLASIPGLEQCFAGEHSNLVTTSVLNVAGRQVGEIRPQAQSRDEWTEALKGVRGARDASLSHS